MYTDDTIALVNNTAGRRWRRWRLPILLAVIAGVVLALGATLVACSGLEEPEIAAEEPSGVPQPGLEPIVLEWDPESGQEPDPQPQTIPLDEEQQTGTSLEGPCPGIIGDGLIVTPNPVHIPAGNKGAIDIQNCDTEAVDWTASTVAWVELAETHGELASGAVFRLLFTVDTASLPTGQYSFTIAVNGIDVAVTGTKLGGFVAPGAPAPSPVPTVGGLIAPGLSACATKCITKAWLTTLPNRADMALEVRTNTPARIVAHLDTEAPAYSTDGDPFFTSPKVSRDSENRRQEWHTELSPLQPETKYHIVVAARDAQGGISYQTGTFRTPAVADQLAGNEPGGCSTTCVSRAVLTPRFGTPDLDIEVSTLVPAQLRVFANDVELGGTGGEFVTEWSAVLDLEPGQNYEITLRVTDEQGRTQQHSAKVSTPKPVPAHQNTVLVTFHKIYVHDDADNTFFNRKGELTFRFEVNGERTLLDTGERKVQAPASLSLDVDGRGSGRGVVIENAPDVLPIRVQAQERDNNKPGFCSAGFPFFTETSGRTTIPHCYELEWNTAEGPIDLHPAGNDALPECYGFPDGVRGDLCVVLHAGGEDPAFDVYITIDFAE